MHEEKLKSIWKNYLVESKIIPLKNFILFSSRSQTKIITSIQVCFLFLEFSNHLTHLQRRKTNENIYAKRPHKSWNLNRTPLWRETTWICRSFSLLSTRTLSALKTSLLSWSGLELNEDTIRLFQYSFSLILIPAH